MLMDSIIAMVVVGILAAGPGYLMAKANRLSANAKTQVQAIGQMQNLLATQSDSLCEENTAHAITIGGLSRVVEVTCTEVEFIQVDGQSVQGGNPAISLTLRDDGLFDGQVLHVSE